MGTTIGALAHELAAQHNDTVNFAVHAVATYAAAVLPAGAAWGPTPLMIELNDEQADRIRALYDAGAHA